MVKNHKIAAALLISVLAMTGCMKQTAYCAADINTGKESAQSETTQADAGKVKKIYSANAGKVLVWTDKTYLYDLKADQVTAEAKTGNLDEIDCRAIEGGYAVIGRVRGGNLSYSCSFYDEKLKLLDTVGLSQVLNGDLVVSTKLIGITEDGRKLAAAGMEGLYLYDRMTKKTEKLIDFNGADEDGRKGIVTIEKIAFAQQGNKIAFKAQSFSVPAKNNERSFDTFGWINADGTGLVNKRIAGYEAKELTVYNDFLLLAEDFRSCTGKLMMMDMATGKQKIHTLKTAKESGTVYGSDQGAYFATATLSDSLQVRIYDTATGALLKEKMIAVADPLYVARIPEITILDELKTCIVVLGNRQETLETQVERFDF